MIEVPELLKPIDKQAPQPATPPPNASLLADAARSFGQRQSQDFLHSMETVAKINPDSYAKATAVSRYSGIPAQVLHDNTERMNELLRGNEYAGIYDRYRKTANALRDGNLAAISQDDLDQLTRIEGAASDTRFNERSLGEKLFGAFRQQWVAMRQATSVAGTSNLLRLATQFDEIDAEIARAAEAGEEPFAAGRVPGGFGGQYLLASPEERQQMRANLQLAQQDRIQSAITDEAELAAMPVDPGARRAAELEAMGRSSLSATAEALGEFPGFGVRVAVGAGATSLPMLAAGAVGGPVAAGAVGFGTEYDTKLLDVLREAGVDAGDPKAILRALQDESLIQDAERRAALKAGGTTAVDMISMGLASKLLAPSRIAGRTLTQGQRELVNLAIQMPVQGVSEGLGEATGQFAAEGEVDAGEVLLETVAGAGMSSLDVIAFSNRRLIENLGDGLRRARAARVGQESLDEMVDASLASKTRGRDADTFATIAGAQLADSPMETLWIPADALQRLNQSSQVNLPELLQQVPGLGEQFAEAAARGGSVSMKTSDYLKLFADYHQELSSSVRISVDGMSPAEVDAWTAEQEAQMDDLAASLQMEPDQQRAAFDETVGQLVAVGFRRADAEQYASTHLSVLNNLAERTGQALEQIRNQFPLNIRTQALEPLQRIKVDDARLAIQRLRAGDIPRPADMFGQSLREYLVASGGVSDEGGELAALDADVGRVGRNRLTRAGGKSLDQAAMDAWERGYFPGVPREEVGPQLIIDAIQREQAGQPAYSVEQENATLREQADTLGQLQDYLDRLGVDLEQMTDDEVLALLQGGAEQIEGRRQDQFAGPTAWTADVAALADAQQRLADGDTAEQVRKDTGWFQGADGRWRFEIDDSAAQFKPLEDWVERASEPGRVTLRDVLDHPALFAAYPEIARVSVVVEPDRQAGGYFGAQPGRGFTGAMIVIGDPSAYQEGVAPAIDVLMHEIQHAIQTREGFATGGSPDVLRAEKDQAMADRDYWSAVATIRRDAERLGGDFEQAARDYTDIFEEQVTDQQMEDARKAESLQVLEQRAAAAEEVMRNIGNPTATYTRLAGEIEARNTEARRTMTAEERRAASPEQTADTPGQDAIVWWNGTEMVSHAVDAQAGSLSPAGERTRRAAFRRLKAELGPRRLNQGETREQLVERLVDQNPGLKLDLLGRGQRLLLSRIELPKEGRQQGAGTRIMQEITAWADANGATVSLSPSSDFGGNKKRLVEFYKRFGFVENKGRARDFEISEAMYRMPMRRLNQDYHMEHRPPGPEDGAPLSDLTGDGNIYPEDVYSANGPRYYGTGHRSDAEAFRKANSYRGNPEAPVTIYRAVPLNAGDEINPGDWVAITKSYAEDHGEGLGDHKIISKQVKAGEIFTNVDSIQEFGYWPGDSYLEQSGDDDARGFITFTPRGQGDRRFQITLGEKRDLSTFLHELGHYYLEVIDDIAAGENAPQQIVKDVATIRQWLGAEQGGPLTTEQHEQFARGFEAYLAEGKAPNPELAGAFARFKRWLIAIYKDLARLNVELTDDVRRVFDRLVATDEQIVAAEQVSNAIPLFRDAQAAGMTEAEFAAYQDSIELAHADARDAVEEEVVREEERRRSKWWREESARVRNEVTEEVDTLPEYAAMRALRKGIMPDGSQLNLKLSSAELTERYGASVTRRLAFTHSKSGQPLDVVAPMLGYESGDELVKAMLGAPSRAEAIRRETEQRMLERHGPRSTSEAAERALDAVHNERRADVLAKELRRLGQVGNRRNITSQQILKEAARRVMSQRKVRDIQPAEYQRAEAKAGREAFEAFTRGNLEAAYEAKQRQLLNFYMYREARKAREQIDGIVNRLAKYNKRSKREQLGKAGHDYLDQIDAVMEQYEFRNVSLREIDKRVSFQAWYADQLAQGNEPFVPEFILNTSQRVNYKELSLAQLQELDEFVANVNHLAKLKNQLIANKRLRDFDEARSELIRVGYENLEKRKKPPIDKNTRSMLERIGDQAGELSSALIKMEQVVDWLDGGQVDGPWSTTFWQPFVEAQGEKERLNREFAIKMADLVDAYTKERGAKVMHQKTYINSLGESLTHNAILSAALNTGNDGNRTKLLNGGHNGKAWTEQQLNEITGNLTARDWEFVQSMWDLVEELWPSISQLEKDLHGIPPEKVEAVPVQTQFGVFRGGYWPLVYDTSSSAYAGVQNQLGNEGGLFEQGYARATTPKGHTKARVDAFAAPILLDVEIVAQHLGQVIHDLTHRKAIRDGAKIIGDKQIKQMLIDTLGSAVANQFNPWLQGVANDMVLDSQKGIDAWTRAAERLRANLAVGFLGFSATTGLQQILGYSQTFDFFSKIGAKRYVFRGMQQFITKPFETVEFVNQLSSEMRYRVDNLDRDMRGVLKQISGKSGFLDVVQRLAFKHIGVIQAMVDYPTWLAGYYHGLDNGLTADDAVAAGDRAVRLSQMAAGPKDLAAVQRKDGLMRALTIVYSYFNLLYNRTVDLKNSTSAARSVGEYLNAFERTMFLIAIPAIAGPLVTGHGPGDDEDWRAWASLKILTYPLLGIPGVRDLASSLESGWAYRGATPIGEVFNTLSKFRGVATNVVEGNENDTARVAGLTIDAVGYTFGLPTAQPKRTVKYLIGVSEGDIEPEGVTDWVRGVLFGPPKQ